jgi:hypothetical protein
MLQTTQIRSRKLISHNTAEALKRYVDTSESNLLSDTVNNWFDVMNSRTMAKAIRKLKMAEYKKNSVTIMKSGIANTKPIVFQYGVIPKPQKSF